MIKTLISVFGTILGTILGWSLNCIYESKVKKVKLCYSLQSVKSIDEIEPELRTKYSDSDYCIKIYNVGMTPFLLDRFTLIYKKTILDCDISEKKAIMPYQSYTYYLNEQEYDVILYYCKKRDIKKCKVFAYDVNDKRCVGKMDLFFPHLQSNFYED